MTSETEKPKKSAPKVLKKVSGYPKAPVTASSHTDSSDEKKSPQHENKRNVTFFGQVRVFETIHRDDYTEEELVLAWYRKRDFTMIKAMFAGTVQQLANGTYQGDSDYETARGLEYRHREGAMRRKTNKLNALYAVLDEQERQWRKGYENDEELSAIFIKCNMHCRKAAHDLAVKDEEECRRLWSIHDCDTDDDDDASVSSEYSEASNVSSMGGASGGSAGDKKKKKKKSSRLKKFLKTLKHEKHPPGAPEKSSSHHH